MLAFANLLITELEGRNVSFKISRPASILGRRVKSHRGLAKWFGYVDKFFLYRPDSDVTDRKSCVHILDHSNAVYVPRLRGISTLISCHDLLAIRSARGEFPQNKTGMMGKVLQNRIVSGLYRATHVTCISNATKADLLRIVPRPRESTSVTYMGLNYPYASFEQNLASERLAALGIGGKQFLLHVGGNQWYKNRTGVLQIFNASLRFLPSSFSLMMVGKPPTAEMLRFVASAGIQARVTFRTMCENETLRALYSSAECLLFPSLYEGFGWPIIEAQACGCRVVTTNREPMTEVGGPGCVYIDPNNLEESAIAIKDLLNEPAAAREARINAGFENIKRFSTEKMIDSYISLYEKLLGHPVPRSN